MSCPLRGLVRYSNSRDAPSAQLKLYPRIESSPGIFADFRFASCCSVEGGLKLLGRDQAIETLDLLAIPYDQHGRNTFHVQAIRDREIALNIDPVQQHASCKLLGDALQTRF